MTLQLVSENQWKKYMEGRSRGIVDDDLQYILLKGEDCIREYRRDGEVVARMTVYKSNTLKLGHICDRKFELISEILLKVDYIYIPSTEESEEWYDLEIYEREVSKRELTK